MKLKVLIFAASFAACLLLVHFPVNASVNCVTQYGGAQICTTTGQLQINKTVWNPDSKTFVDNLSLTDHLFLSGEIVVFDISVKNTGDATFDTVSVSDTLPTFLQLASGSLNYTINNLAPGATDLREIRVVVVPASQIPASQTTLCVVNNVTATADGSSDHDSSQVCLQRKVLAAQILPPTGPAGSLFFLLGIIALGSTGLFFSKNTLLLFFRRGVK